MIPPVSSVIMLSKWSAAPAPIWTRAVVRLVKVMRGAANLPLVTTIGRLVSRRSADSTSVGRDRATRSGSGPAVSPTSSRRRIAKAPCQGDEYDRDANQVCRERRQQGCESNTRKSIAHSVGEAGRVVTPLR